MVLSVRCSNAASVFRLNGADENSATLALAENQRGSLRVSPRTAHAPTNGSEDRKSF